MNRRDFTKLFIVPASVFLPNHRIVGAVRHKYRLASETTLPEGLRNAPDEIRKAYRSKGGQILACAALKP